MLQRRWENALRTMASQAESAESLQLLPCNEAASKITTCSNCGRQAKDSWRHLVGNVGPAARRFADWRWRSLHRPFGIRTRRHGTPLRATDAKRMPQSLRHTHIANRFIVVVLTLAVRILFLLPCMLVMIRIDTLCSRCCMYGASSLLAGEHGEIDYT